MLMQRTNTLKFTWNGFRNDPAGYEQASSANRGKRQRDDIRVCSIMADRYLGLENTPVQVRPDLAEKRFMCFICVMVTRRRVYLLPP